MKVAITGATGFVGRYIVRKMHDVGNSCRCWFRSGKNCYEPPKPTDTLEWTHGELGDQAACDDLLKGCDAVVHSGLHRTGESFRGGEGDTAAFVQKNVVGTIQLIEAARRAGVRKFVFISTCAVHERILDDRPLDESHPLWMTTHYGAHKAAVEQFVHSYGFGVGFPICALRPTGVYGRHHEPHRSKWFELVKRVANGESFECSGGGKEVHAADVAEAVDILLHSNDNAGEVYSCYDRYVSQFDVASIARDLSGSDVEIPGTPAMPRHQIVSDKIKGLGLQFGGEPLLKQTIQELIDASR
ncbi:MAG: NAD(P)-dependent oxidoreductase [Fuerstiella sp.]|jgi:nucleoside-diphosphate-sugar epimerase|nr:NAD(P)-dependent oxidoreductase [Fuerstiella sp.]